MFWLAPASMPPVNLPEHCFLHFPIMNPTYHVPHTRYHCISLTSYFVEKCENSRLEISLLPAPPRKTHIPPPIPPTPALPLILQVQLMGCTFRFVISTVLFSPFILFVSIFNKDLVLLDWPRWSACSPQFDQTSERFLPDSGPLTSVFWEAFFTSENLKLHIRSLPLRDANRLQASSQFCNLEVSFSRTWGPSLWNVIILETGPSLPVFVGR